ncbi:UDP-GlcNAc:betaGal beta-1,3-N-acetylglucosaminyltransferase 9 [Drosophila gunungcola]|uniref:Uncharacterized protein n=1 Tax=Drosophila gunungcola TaxID=103775 RepID=A0A9P9YVR7_9MUSC|nr:UDP-GlcNAc:betaGal beta-1,3-N-acetylglucosaminyltransferase 9 [Drosophila gunungcola]XP_052851638.1 UDP-GlcNAc:betaGal beta-1,3-N-acetylglucosaminyltransferase 9 [Drosophila gunungcola]XP_052851639.1 UDP-GlcNAc:betaGal beta-1,3-N-acetylglucosaminyltransferase 9 [Drosophila gunungcola]KAI8043658.1 hypothetical protein M5D96_004991 [Drosophila gunungcola]
MVAVGNLHNTRMLRFLLVLIVVILTIFIYASYSTTGTLTASHLHSAASPPQQLVGVHPGRLPMEQVLVVNNTDKEYVPPAGVESAAKVATNRQSQQQPAEIHKKHPQHRLPTIDEDALLDGGSAGASPQVGGPEQTPNGMADELLEEQQYGQSVDGITGNINSSTNNNNSSSGDTLVVKQAIPAQSPQQQQTQSQVQPGLSDAELLIPTSNLQKFIENADKILKNITSNSSTGNGVAVPATGTDPNTDKGNQPDVAQLNLVDGPLEGPEMEAAKQEAESKVIQEIKEAKKEAAVPSPKSARPPVPVAKTTKSKIVAKEPPNAPVDPSKGVATEQLYEPGHLDEEVDAERICPRDGEFIKLLVLISSAMSHDAARMSIRQTWMHYGSRRDVGMAFVLGRGTNETLNKALTQENFIYGDLIRGNFIDSYNNLTLKTISTLEWADLHCPKAKYILKTDDDMFINVPKLLTFLDKHKDKRTIYGRLAKKWKPIRNKKSKYYVAVDQFAAGVFPSFTTGPAYVLTGDIVHELYVRSLKTVYLKLEDVFTTGIVAKSLNIKRVQANEFVNRRISFNPCNIRNAISVHMIKSNEQFDLWKKLLDQTTKCK